MENRNDIINELRDEEEIAKESMIDLVTIHEIAEAIGLHKTNVLKGLKRLNIPFAGRIRDDSGQYISVVTKDDAKRFVRERFAVIAKKRKGKS